MKYLPSWFPGAGFKRQAIEWEQAVSDTYDLPWKDVKTVLVGIFPSRILVKATERWHSRLVDQTNQLLRR